MALNSATMIWGQADANKAQLSGVVTDPKGGVVAGATVKIKNLQTGFLREMVTGGDGLYRAVQLDAGTYQLVAQSTGFSATTLDGIELNVGSSVRVDIPLQVQATTTTVEVSDSLLNAELPQPSVVLTTKAITDLPINGRRFQDLALLTPTVQVDPSRSQISFAGQRGINSNIMVDGADYNQPFFGGIRGGERSNSIITVPQTSVQEFQAIATGYSAEYGRSTGGILNVISKSGTNSWHGEAFYQNRDSGLSANGPIPIPDIKTPGAPLVNVQPAESLQQWGGGIGGPIKRDKLFLYTSYEEQRAVQPRQIVFPSLIGYTPTAGQAPVYNFFKSQEGPLNKVNNAGAGTIRGDYALSNGSRLTLRYNRSGSEEVNAVTVGGAIEAFTTNAASNEGIEQDKVHFGTADLTTVLSPSVVNDLKFSGSYEQRPRLANSAIPGITISALGNIGTRNFLPTIEDDSRYQLTDSLTWIKGSHALKVGLDFNKLHTFQTFGFNQFGVFNFTTSNISQILDILSGTGTVSNRFDSSAVNYSRQIGNLVVDYGATQAAVFAQDSWRATRSLVIDYGLRWEGQWNPSVASTNTTLVNNVNSVTFPNGARTDVGNIPNALRQFMPRFGFAWTPTKDQRFVIRGHTGIFYASSPMLIFSDPTGNFRATPNNVSLVLNATSKGSIYQQFKAVGVDLNQGTLGGLPLIPIDSVSAAASYGLGVAPDPFAGASVTTVARDFQNPRSYQFGVGGEARITSNWTAGVQFHYVNTVHLERNRDYNLPTPIVNPNDASGRPYYGIASPKVRPRPIDSLGTITVRESSARSLYRGTVFSTQYRGKKLLAGFEYTLAYNYSDDDNERDSGGASAMDQFNYKLDYGYSNLDARHQFGSYAVYTLPWGFEVSGSLGGRSGLPVNPRTGSDTNGDAASTDRAFMAVGVPFARNSFRNRAVINNNLRLMKNFKIRESMRLQLSAELFNFLNLDNVVFAGTTTIYGVGVDAKGQPAPIDSRWLVLKSADGRYNTQNQQIGFPFQAQFGVRFFF